MECLKTVCLLLLLQDEEELRVLQENRWGPILEWFEKRFDVKLEVSGDLLPPPLTTETRASLAKHLLSYDFASLNGTYYL